jgi:ABC-type antimicrobial peptide transport system permease subunit
MVTTVRHALGGMDRSTSVAVEPMVSALQLALLPSRVGAAVLGTLGVLGLLLAAFGLYAMVSYNVSRRIGEIAIRSALGASRGAIVGLVIRDASLHVGVGLLVGLGISALVTTPLTTFLVAGPQRDRPDELHRHGTRIPVGEPDGQLAAGALCDACESRRGHATSTDFGRRTGRGDASSRVLAARLVDCRG